MIPPSGRQFELTRGNLRAVIVEVGGGIREFRLDGTQVVDGFDATEECTDGRGQILVPWPNRIRGGQYAFSGQVDQLAINEPVLNNAIHGLARCDSWVPRNVERSSVALAHTIHPQPGYPHALALIVQYSLSDAGLTASLTATNIGDRPCPYGAGAHPYVTVGTEFIDTALLRVEAETHLLTDSQRIPVGRASVAGTMLDFRDAQPIGARMLDACLTDLGRDVHGCAHVVMRNPETGREVSLWFDEMHSHLMLFTGDPLNEARRRRGLAIEPMTCAPDAFNSGDGLRVLEPEEAMTSVWGITISRAS